MTIEDEFYEMEEVDTAIVRRYIGGGHIPTAGLVLQLCGEIDALREFVSCGSDTAPKTSVRASHRTTAVLCGVDGCDQPPVGTSDYCKKHDMRYRRHGDPTKTLRPWGRKRASASR